MFGTSVVTKQLASLALDWNPGKGQIPDQEAQGEATEAGLDALISPWCPWALLVKLHWSPDPFPGEINIHTHSNMDKHIVSIQRGMNTLRNTNTYQYTSLLSTSFTIMETLSYKHASSE